jgi:hypothetical protein
LSTKPLGHRIEHVAVVVNKQQIRFGHGVS